MLRNYVVSLDDIKKSHSRIKSYIHKTPVMTSGSLNDLVKGELFFKAENFQKTGSFKIRGALNAMASLAEEERSKGVVTHSSGNFAQAVAFAGKLYKSPVLAVMPESSSLIKRQAVTHYGAKIHLLKSAIEKREEEAEIICEKTGGAFLHPSNQAEVIAGQGTIALELMEQVPQLDKVIVPIGGGGLISGLTLAMKELNPSVKIIGAEPKGADDAWCSKSSGRLLEQKSPQTIADGLLTSLGHLTWPVVRDLVSEIITVSDEEILNAMALVWERLKILVEPSAAVPLAAILSQNFCSGKTAVILSGGNIDFKKFSWEMIK